MTYRDVMEPSPSDTRVADGRRVVVAVGIDRYRAWPALNNAVNDAKGALAVFERLGFEQVVAPLTDEGATADAVRRLVTDDLATLRGDDSLVLFFAGHGHTRTRTLQGGPVETGFLIPVDGDPPDGRAATWLRLDSWLSDVARLPARHILVILDACHSGVALGSVIKWRDGGGRDGSLDELHRRQSRRVITSALGDQLAMDSGPIHGHSLFTGCLIEALTGGLARDGRREATGSELGVYVQRRVTSYTRSQQTPDFGTLELDHRGEIILPIAGNAGPDVAPIRPPEPDRTGSPDEPGRRVLVSSSAPVTPPVTPPMFTLVTPNVRPALKITVRERWAAPRQPWLASLPMFAQGSIWFFGLSVIATPFALLASATGTRILFLIGSGALVLAIAAGRWVSDVPPPLRWISATLLRGKWWTALALGAIAIGSLIGMVARSRLEKVCREEIVDPDIARQGNRDQIKLTAAKACRSIGRDDEARVREAEIAQPASASAGAPNQPRPTASAAEAKAVPAPREEAEQPSTFAAALAEAQRQPETADGTEAAIAGYRRAMQAGVLDGAQQAQFALRLRAYGRALLAKHDYDGASCALEEAKVRDPKLDVAADLAAVHAAEHPRDRSKSPTGGSGDPDALEAVTRVDMETGKVYPEYSNRRGCRVPADDASRDALTGAVCSYPGERGGRDVLVATQPDSCHFDLEVDRRSQEQQPVGDPYAMT